jgi:signal transduction histidine kinase/ActR/RegA family two-component response regulator
MENERMQLNDEALRWLNDLLSQGVMLTDADLTIRGWNLWLESHSGYKAAEMIGRNLFDVYPDLVTRRLDEYYKDALARQVRVVAQRLHGYLLSMPPPPEASSFAQMQQSAKIAPVIVDDAVIGTVSMIDDVTERVERENRLVELLLKEQALRAEAESANRAKDEFLAIVSHELRTPLNAILGWVQILRSGKFDNEASAHALETIERSAKAQTRLIDDILDASRIINGKLHLDLRPVDLASIVEAAIDTVRPAADTKSIQIETDLGSWVGPVSGDPSRLQQIIWNLLYNAIKFTPPRGLVQIRLRLIDSQVEFTVTDTGQGIKPEFLPHVFDRFRQADSSTTRKQGGLGLGLAIVRQLVEMHSGTVFANSEGEGRGATFTVRLPLIAVHGSDEPVVTKPAEATDVRPPKVKGNATDLPRLENLRVLVVDDESDTREILTIILTQCGAELRAASNASDALESLKRWRPDVLVSDVGMPGEDGYLLISRVRALRPEDGGRTPAVALTGYAGPEARLRLLSAGYNMHVTKPVELSELVMVVASLAGVSAKGQIA